MCQNFEDIDLNDVESTFRSNILQAFAITKYAIPHMTRGDSYVKSLIVPPYAPMLTVYCPRIINTTSVVTFRGTASMIDYASTKGAIVGFTRALAKNLIPKGIRVNAVA